MAARTHGLRRGLLAYARQLTGCRAQRPSATRHYGAAWPGTSDIRFLMSDAPARGLSRSPETQEDSNPVNQVKRANRGGQEIECSGDSAPGLIPACGDGPPPPKNAQRHNSKHNKVDPPRKVSTHGAPRAATRAAPTSEATSSRPAPTRCRSTWRVSGRAGRRTAARPSHACRGRNCRCRRGRPSRWGQSSESRSA